MASKLKRFLIGLVAGALALSCSSTPKKTPELSKMEGKKVALIEIEGESTSRSIVEVALVNQLLQHGSFVLVSKQDVEAARRAPEQDPRDWKGIAKRAGADYALRGKILEFDADTREGYSSEEVEDSQLAEERGEDAAKTERLFKVKSVTGKVRVELEFADLNSPKDPKDNDTRIGIAESQDQVVQEERKLAARMPPKLRFLEKIANEAFRKFFEIYSK